MECQDWKSVVDAVNEPAVQRIYAEVERLRAENEALRKDAARLDYVLSKAPYLTIPVIKGKFRIYGRDEDFYSVCFSGDGCDFDTGRDAIDASMKGGE